MENCDIGALIIYGVGLIAGSVGLYMVLIFLFISIRIAFKKRLFFLLDREEFFMSNPLKRIIVSIILIIILILITVATIEPFFDKNLNCILSWIR